MKNLPSYVSKTSREDSTLFEELGLSSFELYDQKEYYLGTYKFPNYEEEEDVSVKIYVTCMPDQFWRFEISTLEREKYELNTGSGILSDYWNTVELFAEGMIGIKKIEP